MQPMSALFQLTLGDYRRATYYGLFLRYHRALQIMFAVLIGGLGYVVASASMMREPHPLVFFLGGAYLIWGLLTFAGAERDVRRYLKRPDHLIGCEYRFSAEDHRVRFQIPARKVDASFNLHGLACAFELNELFLFYVDTQEVYLLPKRALTGEQIAALRAELASDLGDRFSSRFVKRAKK